MSQQIGQRSKGFSAHSAVLSDLRDLRFCVCRSTP